jgi:acyl carrier protein
MSPEEVREKNFDELLALLEALLAQVSQGSPSPLQMPIDHDAALVELGLDSMSVVQFKGAVEGSLHAVLPDEMMFTTLATLKNLTEVVKHGGVTDRLRSEIDAGLAPAPGQGTATIALKDEPCCPWFIGCC